MGTRHRSRGLAADEPASGDPLRYPELAPRTAAPSWHPRLITTGSTVQVRRLSTSAITTVLEHDSRFDPNIPTDAAPEVAPLLGVLQAALRLAARSRSSRRGFRGQRASCDVASISRQRLLARELLPDPIVPDTPCRRFRVRAGRRAEHGYLWNRGSRGSAGGRRARRLPHKGCVTPPSAKRVAVSSPEVPSIDGRAPEGWCP